MNWMTRTITATAATAILTGGPLFRSVHGAEPSGGKAFRPPAVPLITADPYFSIWSFADTLTGAPTTHWTGKKHALTSLVLVDGRTFRLMGDAPANVAAMPQTSIVVQPTQSIYTFEGSGIVITMTFTSPLLPDDLSVMSRPVSYVTWSVRSTDGKAHEAAIYFDASPEIAVNTPDQRVITSRSSTLADRNVLVAGSEEQNVLLTSGDDRRIDWGHFYIASDASKSRSTIALAVAARDAFASNSELSADAAGTAPAGSGMALVMTWPLGKVSSEAVTRHVTLAYDDELSIKYFRDNLKPYWRKDGMQAADLLAIAEKDYEALLKRCSAFDAELVGDLKKIGGESYAQIGVLAWRQAIAAQKICADANGQPLSFSKENFSNGCMSTVDVLYPASPQMLVFAPSLLKASLVPLLDYSASPLWKHKSAPHDLGTYPIATGQAYGDDAPMPVEESGNMLLMLAALSKVEGNADFAGKYWPVLTTWYDYLKANGLDPTNQLTTDDFAGHIARNSNLSGKAILAIAAYGMMAEMLGKTELAADAHATAVAFARKWTEMGADGDHYALVFGEEGKGTWSQKYNLVWDKLLELNVFPPEVVLKEMAFYKTKMNRYGLPLDSRREYTKLDWEFWTGTMGSDADFRALSDSAATWANHTPDRAPLGDWYQTVSGKKEGFQARSVVGGVFIGLMKDQSIWKKYASRDTLKPADWAPLPWMMPPLKKLVAAADTAPAVWKYTITKPEDGWMATLFDDKDWDSGQSGFGVRSTPGAVVHTAWNSDDIYLRREFELPAGNFNNPQLFVHHDDDVEIYVNGVLALKSGGFITSYQPRPMAKAAVLALKAGTNTLAVHCHQHGGGQYIDVGLVDVLPMPK